MKGDTAQKRKEYALYEFTEPYVDPYLVEYYILNSRCSEFSCSEFGTKYSGTRKMFISKKNFALEKIFTLENN